MKRLKHWWLSLIVVAVAFATYPQKIEYWWLHWQRPWVLLLLALVPYLTVKLMGRFHWSVGPAFASTCASSIMSVAIKPDRPNAQLYPVVNYEVLGRWSGYSIMSFLILVLVFVLVDRKELELLRKTFGWLCLLNAIATIWLAIE